MNRHQLAFWFARRYLFSRRHRHASFIHWVSFGGLALGVMILTVVVSVMNGFDQELSKRILGAVPDVLLYPDAPSAQAPPMLADLEGVASVARFFQGEAMMVRRGGVRAVGIYGLDPQGRDAYALFSDSVVEGDLQAVFLDDRSVAVGAPLARYMGLLIGDPVILVVPEPSGTAVRPRLERFRLVATFEIGQEPDFGLILTGYDTIRERGFLAAGVDAVRVDLAEPLDVAAVRDAIEERLPAGWTSSDWTRDYGELFRAVRIEKAIMFVLLALIVAIAAFNIVSGQAMIVNDKRGDIAMLTTIGAPRRLLAEVFLIQGFSVAALGIVVGLTLGVLIAANAGTVVGYLESLAGASMIDGSYFDEIPSRILLSDLVIISGLSALLCFAAVLHPALKAVNENPAEALHEA